MPTDAMASVLRSAALVLALGAATEGSPLSAGPLEGERAAGDRPLMVRAWRKTGKARAYETRILKHLDGFEAQAKPQLDRYGGWVGPKYGPTGFFHTRRVGDRWWLIDPAGHRFLHIAVNSVRPGRGPQMRKALPQKFGDRETWRDETIALLQESGFNGTGSWSDDELNATARRRPVYTPNLKLMSSYGARRGGVVQLAGHKGYPNRCMFVFDPGFEKFALERARKLRALRDDPYLLGYFSDNELPFPRDSLDRYLELDERDPGHRAARTWLGRRRGSGSGAPKITPADRRAWIGHVADRYFGIVKRAIRKYDPNHLYLGSRFYGEEKGCAEVFRAAGKHVDLVSVNVYGVWTPGGRMLERWAGWSGRPLLITEWYAKGDDSGLANETGAGWTVPTQQDRGWFYQNFVLALLESKVCVGWHWFKYQDNDPTDPRTDPSNRNSNKGIVNVRYEPYSPLLRAMRRLNEQVYPLTMYFEGNGR